jgi:hypothetical protein
MIRRWMSVASIAGMIALFLSGCGSSVPSVPVSITGTVMVTVGDVPVCNTLSFRGLLTSLNVKTATSPALGPAVLPANSALTVDFAALQDTSTYLASASVPIGTYIAGTISISAPEMDVYDPGQSPPVVSVTPTFTETNIPFTISPPLVVTANTVSALQIDLNIPQTFGTSPGGPLGTTSSSGGITVTATPALSGSALTSTPTGGFGEMDDVNGYITSVNTTSGNASFIGGFVMQILSGMSVSGQPGPAVTVNLTSQSDLIGAPALNQILTNSFAEVDGYIDTNGNFVANTAVIEDQADLSNSFTAFLGAVISVQRDAEGNVTQFQMSVRDQEPSTTNGSGNSVPLGEPPVVVNVLPTTGFHFSSPSTNFADLVPDAAYLVPGQQVVVQGTYLAPASGSTSPSTINAQDIYIPLQSVQGQFVSVLAAGADNLTGGFSFSTCSNVYQGLPLYVVTNAQTDFLNVSGLSGLTPAPPLVVRGLLFFDQPGGEFEGVQIPSGSLVMFTKKVDQH